MKLPTDKFCVLPWISLEASPIGTVRTCCLAESEITDDHGEKFVLTSADLKSIQNSSYMKDLREKFLAGEQPQTCRKCWNEERSGRTSKRMHTLNRLKHYVADQTWTADAKPLMFLDLKLGNICNLKCRICGSWSSSQFATEELNDLPLEIDKKSSYPYTMLRAGAWPRDNEFFWNEVDNVIDEIRYIEFTGGEPFMINEHFTMLENLVQKGRAGEIEIHYNTNGSIWPPHAAEIWQHFKTVEVAFSIDDVNERFEYQRTNAIWDEVQDNIDKFFALKQKLNNLKLQVCCTVNVFNVLYLDEVASWIDTKDFDFVYWNMMHESWYFSIRCLPDSVKHIIANRLKNTPLETWKEEFNRVCDFMMNGASTDGFMTKMKIHDLDRKRRQNLKTVAPELATLLGYDYQT